MGDSCHCQRMSHEPSHVICAMIGLDAPAGDFSSAIMLPSVASTVVLRLRA